MMVEAVLRCHFNGVSHNDIKPKNFLLMPDGLIKLTDFGLAVAHNELPGMDPSDPHRNRKVSFKKGTPGYVAPEILEIAGPHDAYLADVYALGVCLYDMLTGVYANDNNLEGAYRKNWPGMQALSYEAQDLLNQLLLRDPRGRPLLSDVLDHPFMTGVKSASCTALVQAPVGHVAAPADRHLPYGFALHAY